MTRLLISLWSLSVRICGPECPVTAWLERKAWERALSEHSRRMLRCCQSEACFGDGVCSCGYEREEETEE